MQTNRFVKPWGGRRVAAFMSWNYPCPHEAARYAELDAMAQAAGVELKVFHLGMPDPSTLPKELRPRLGGGIYTPFNDLVFANDRRHWERTQPERLQKLVATLAQAWGCGDEQVLADSCVRAGLSLARWAQAWGADAVHSGQNRDQALHAWITAELLQTPRSLRVMRMPDAPHERAGLCLHATQAAVVAVDGESLMAALNEGAGCSLRDRMIDMARGPAVWGAALRLSLQHARPFGAAELGPDAAFLSLSAGEPQPRAAKPFLVLGAERTGSNLLVGMLAGQRAFACAGELFNPRDIDENKLSWIHEASADLSDLRAVRRADPALLLARLLADGAATGADWVGFKLLYYHGLIDDRVTAMLAQDERLPVVHLRRRDRLGRWVSHHKADLYDDWFTAKGEARRKAQPLHLDLAQTVADFAFAELVEERYEATFRRLPTLELDYDDFTADLVGTGRKLARFFGERLGEMVPRSQKTGLRKLSEAIANYDSLASALDGTRWADLAPVEVAP